MEHASLVRTAILASATASRVVVRSVAIPCVRQPTVRIVNPVLKIAMVFSLASQTVATAAAVPANTALPVQMHNAQTVEIHVPPSQPSQLAVVTLSATEQKTKSTAKWIAAAWFRATVTMAMNAHWTTVWMEPVKTLHFRTIHPATEV